jgi:hypothetical protein
MLNKIAGNLIQMTEPADIEVETVGLKQMFEKN